MYNSKKQNNDSATIFVTIGAISSALKINQRTLRIYDKEGILIPERNKNNRRLYTLNDFEKAKFILFLTRNLAINLAGVKIILSLLAKERIKPKDYTDYINNLAKSVRINTEIQNKNIEKVLKKGRPKSEDNKTKIRF